MTRQRKVFTRDELLKIIEQREEWAALARERDMNGSATEMELVADMAAQLVELLSSS
jgi:hypothetical protein